LGRPVPVGGFVDVRAIAFGRWWGGPFGGDDRVEFRAQQLVVGAD